MAGFLVVVFLTAGFFVVVVFLTLGAVGLVACVNLKIQGQTDIYFATCSGRAHHEWRLNIVLINCVPSRWLYLLCRGSSLLGLCWGFASLCRRLLHIEWKCYAGDDSGWMDACNGNLAVRPLINGLISRSYLDLRCSCRFGLCGLLDSLLLRLSGGLFGGFAQLVGCLDL